MHISSRAAKSRLVAGGRLAVDWTWGLERVDGEGEARDFDWPVVVPSPSMEDREDGIRLSLRLQDETFFCRRFDDSFTVSRSLKIWEGWHQRMSEVGST